VLESLLVPDTSRVEHEDLFGLLASPDELRVEGVDLEEKGGGHEAGIYFLQVVNVDEVTANVTKQVGFVENDLLGVRKKFSMEGKEAHSCELSGHTEGSHERRQEQERALAGDEPTEHSKEEVVVDSTLDSMLSLMRFVEEDAVLVGLDSREASVLVSLCRLLEVHLKEFPDRTVLKPVYS